MFRVYAGCIEFENLTESNGDQVEDWQNFTATFFPPAPRFHDFHELNSCPVGISAASITYLCINTLLQDLHTLNLLSSLNALSYNILEYRSV